ncbi:MAG: hypothetical protein DRJ51_02700 [Thermoprotei archaeon]|nr:MAG: hypothetical protein DRJ51_02700 [Thermoprotei archaeon]RLF02829.1 MAG: hypothetical protein DRJ59_02460 [Thermoprotei archaeon]
MGELIRIKPQEWRVLKAIPEALSIKCITEKTGLPEYTVSRQLERLRQKFKISFQPAYRKMKLIPLAVIIHPVSDNPPPFTVADRHLFGPTGEYELITAIPPERDVDTYLSLLPGNPLYIITGYEQIFWRPDKAELTLYVEKEKTIIPKLARVKERVKVWSEKKIDVKPVPSEKIDELDLLIIKEKQKYAFEKLRKISRHTGISHQLLSYHFRKHVIKLWAGNRIGVFLNAKLVPFRIYVLEGDFAPAVARTLVELPYFHSSLIDENRAIVLAQPLCSLQPRLYKLFREFNVRLPFGELIMELRLEKTIPDYTQFFQDGKWIIPVEEYLRTRRRDRR